MVLYFLFPENRAILLPIFKSEWLTFVCSSIPAILIWPRLLKKFRVVHLVLLFHDRIYSQKDSKKTKAMKQGIIFDLN